VGAATEIHLTISPSSRFEAIDVRKRLAEDYGDSLDRHQKALYCSLHTTAGYLDPRLLARLRHRSDHLELFFRAFRVLFPPGAPYRHDQMEERTELSEAQRKVEPRNADSHLTFMGAGMRNCVTYPSHTDDPVYFVDLDGESEGMRRERRTTVLAYDQERVVGREAIPVSVSRHPIDAVNLADPRTGFMDRVDDLLARSGIEKGRVDITLEPAQGHAGLTVNEYETLLMQHDLVDVLKDPLRFAAQKGKHIFDDPLAVPGKTLSYARYDFVRVFNSLVEVFGLDNSAVEKLAAKLLAVPARRFLRMKRRISFLATDPERAGRARLVRGTYQSPILVQWGRAERETRSVEVSLVRFD
jgi:thiamine phosphate synthase YjbQ (UPF0047 family)